MVFITSPCQVIKQTLAFIPNFTLISLCYYLSTRSASAKVVPLPEQVSAIVNFITRQVVAIVASSSTSRATAAAAWVVMAA